MALHDTIEARYGRKGFNKGGWRGVVHICSTIMPYEHKIKMLQEQYMVSRITAIRWHAHYKAQKGLE